MFPCLRQKRRFASMQRNWQTVMNRTSPLSCGEWKKLQVSQLSELMQPKCDVVLKGATVATARENEALAMVQLHNALGGRWENAGRGLGHAIA